MHRIREALLRVETASSREIALEAWKTICSLIQSVQTANPTSAFSQICSKEIDLIAKHTSVEDLKNCLIGTAIRASHAYYERLNLNVIWMINRHRR
jgi:hypothetical protein